MINIDRKSFLKAFNLTTVMTTEIDTLSKSIVDMIDFGECGALISGRQRIGKTRAVKFIRNTLLNEYGPDLPVHIWNLMEHRTNITDKQFYRSLLTNMGFTNIRNSETAITLKTRVIHMLCAEAAQNEYGYSVLFIDEAQLLEERDYLYLIDLYNEMERQGIQLFTFLVGQPELVDIKKEFRTQGKLQIVGRFMVNEFVFNGIRDLLSMTVILSDFDKREYVVDGTSVNIARDLFPASYAGGDKLITIAQPLYPAFQKYIKDNSMPDKDIPMKYFMRAVARMIVDYSVIGKGRGLYPDSDGLYECIHNTNYAESSALQLPSKN